MEFYKYESIENSYRDKFVEIVREFTNSYNESNPITWHIQEKIHGSNFSIWYNVFDKSIHFARRGDFLKPVEGFLNYNLIKDRLSECLLKLVEELPTPPTLSVVVYGELFGGGYPGMNNKIKKVQPEIDYTNEIAFCAFDVLVDSKFLTVTTANQLLDNAGFTFSHSLATTTDLNEALAYPDAFKSTIPFLMGMPDHPDQNICEGIVIRPEVSLFLPNDDRIIFKKKNSKFTEKEMKPIKKMGQGTKEDLYPEVEQYISKNRVNAVLSKATDSERQNIGKIISAVIEDTIDDYQKDYPYLDLKVKEQKAIKGRISKSVAPLVRMIIQGK